MENNSSDNEINLSSYKKLKREEIKMEIMDYKEDIPCDQIEPADIQNDLLSLETEISFGGHLKQESHVEIQERRRRRRRRRSCSVLKYFQVFSSSLIMEHCSALIFYFTFSSISD